MFEIREKPEMVERAMLVSIYFDPSEAGEKQALDASLRYSGIIPQSEHGIRSLGDSIRKPWIFTGKQRSFDII